jgi:DNA polymerase I-like protein with 3'-5' exonuclease and polymerase domains
LQRDIPRWEKAHKELDVEIRKKLKITKSWEQENCKNGVFNTSSGPQLAAAMKRAGKVGSFIQTKKGRDSTKRANLELVCTDKKLLQALSWHGVIETYLSTFMRPWLAVAETAKAGGYIYPSFNTVRSTDEYGNRGGVGTRTGRLSSSDPNLQNIPTSVDDSPHAAILVPLRDWIKKYVEFVGMRDYLLPDEGGVFIGRDYSQQELRILAHYEDGILLQMYNDNPRMDIHDAIRNLIIQLLGVDYGRKAIKIADFSIVYGAGGPRLAAQLGVDLETAARIKSAILTAVPGIADINRRMKRMARDEEPLITWGGRQYFCEEPKEVNGKMRSFEYKMLNLLIQGSAADCTKIAMLNMHQNMDLRVSRPVLQVHDELLWCTQPSQVKKEMARMREAMEDVKFDLPMLTDGKVSTKNGSWASMKEVSW